MKKHIKYALSRYSLWFSRLAMIIGVIAIIQIQQTVAIITVIVCILLAFVIPFLESFIKKEFEMKVVGNSRVTLSFGDLFNEDCFVITTNRNFDVNPTGEYIAEESLLGKFVKKFYNNRISELEKKIREQLSTDDANRIKRENFGKAVKIIANDKIIYLLA